MESFWTKIDGRLKKLGIKGIFCEMMQFYVEFSIC